MRDVCQVDLLVGAKDKQLDPLDVAARVFESFQNCRVLSARLSGSRLEVSLLLPEMPGGYRDSREILKDYIQVGIAGKNVVFVAVHSIREAAPGEVLARTLSRRKR